MSRLTTKDSMTCSYPAISAKVGDTQRNKVFPKVLLYHSIFFVSTSCPGNHSLHRLSNPFL